MLLFYYINLVKYKKNFGSPRLLECLIIWNGGSREHVIFQFFFPQKKNLKHYFKRKLEAQFYLKVQVLPVPFQRTNKNKKKVQLLELFT